MARLLADEDFDHRIAARLRVLGHDVLTLALLGLAGCRLPDDQALGTATAGRGVSVCVRAPRRLRPEKKSEVLRLRSLSTFARRELRSG